MPHPLYTRERVLEIARAFIRKHGRLPTHTDYANRVDGLPSSATMYKYCPGFHMVLAQEAKTDPTLACSPPSRSPRQSAYWRKDNLFRRGFRAHGKSRDATHD